VGALPLSPVSLSPPGVPPRIALPPFRHLYLATPPGAVGGTLAGAELWGRLLRRERAWLGPHARLAPRLQSLLVGGEAPDRLGEGLVPALQRILGEEVSEGIREWTVEVQDPSISMALLTQWADHGITRVSLRGPALHPELVAGIRGATPLRVAGTLSLGLEGLESRLLALVEAGLEGVTLAESEEELVVSGRGVAGEEPDPAGPWFRVRALLLKAGWIQPELARLHRPGAEPVHGLAILRREPVLGLGPGAVTFRSPFRWWNPSDWNSYTQSQDAPEGVDSAGGEWLSPSDRRLERIWTHLRSHRGVRLPASLGTQLPWLTPWVEGGLAEVKGHRLVLTPEGWMQADGLVLDLVRALESGAPVPGGSTKGLSNENLLA
jgi:hypothetical protein